MSSVLALAARHGKWVLVAGLIVGAMLPDVAQFVRPYIGWLIALLLLTSCVRIGYNNAVGALGNFRDHVVVALILQLLVPTILIVIFTFSGSSGFLVVAFLVMAMGSPIAGSPNLAMMMGSDPAPGLRQLIIGTALLPLTCLPILFYVPGISDVWAVGESALRLLALIFGSAVIGFAIRRKLFANAGEETFAKVDGISAILMGVVVVGLMSAVGEYLYNKPLTLLAVLVVAFAANFGSQFVFGHLARIIKRPELVVTTGIVAGNRNMALFLAALPTAVTDPILLFIGCYQIPMYLTPLLMQWFYNRHAKAS